MERSGLTTQEDIEKMLKERIQTQILARSQNGGGFQIRVTGGGHGDDTPSKSFPQSASFHEQL